MNLKELNMLKAEAKRMCESDLSFQQTLASLEIMFRNGRISAFNESNEMCKEYFETNRSGK